MRFQSILGPRNCRRRWYAPQSMSFILTLDSSDHTWGKKGTFVLTRRTAERWSLGVHGMKVTFWASNAAGSDQNLEIKKRLRHCRSALCQRFMRCLVLSPSTWGHIGPHIVPLYKIIAVRSESVWLRLTLGILLREAKTSMEKKRKKKETSFQLCATLLHCLCIFRSGSNFSYYLLLIVFSFRHFVSPISQGCVCCTFVCRVLPGDIPVRSCCRNSTLGLCLSFFFSPSNKEDSGVLTFTWMTGALHTKHFLEKESSLNKLGLSDNNNHSSFSAPSLPGGQK